MKHSVAPFTDHMFKKASRRHIPLSGTFELTPMCNFDCKMCYVRKSPYEVTSHNRSMLTLEQWLEIANSAKEQGMLFVLLTGGEPLSWPYFWTLYEKLISMGLLISINTNGSLIDDEAIMRFKQMPPKQINITLYGASDETYESLCQIKGMFSKVTYAIESLKSAGIIVKLNCSLTPYNIHDMEKMIEYAKGHKLILDASTYMFPPLRKNISNVGKNQARFTAQEAAFYRMKLYCLQYGNERYQQYLKNILDGFIPPPGLDEHCVDPIDGKIHCRAGKATYWITWDGWMSPCGMMTEPKVDAIKKGFLESWQEICDISDNMRLSGICQTCPNMKVCHSCAAMALTETGTVSGIPKYLCEMVDAMKEIAQKEII